MQNSSISNLTHSIFASVDGGDMTYRVIVDESNNPFFGGLFTKFDLPTNALLM